MKLPQSKEKQMYLVYKNLRNNLEGKYIDIDICSHKTDSSYENKTQHYSSSEH